MHINKYHWCMGKWSRDYNGLAIRIRDRAGRSCIDIFSYEIWKETLSLHQYSWFALKLQRICLPPVISPISLSLSIPLCLWLTHSVTRLGQISRINWQYWLQSQGCQIGREILPSLATLLTHPLPPPHSSTHFTILNPLQRKTCSPSNALATCCSDWLIFKCLATLACTQI